MVDIFALAAFAAAMFVLAITPGPGVFAVTTRAMTSGMSHALVLAAGLLLGDMVYLLFAIYGLSALASSLHEVFTIIRYVGSAYLIWLGISLIRTRNESLSLPSAGGVRTSSRGASFKSCIADLLTGFSVTLGNPKVIFFYLSFLPTFMDLTTLTSVDVLSVCITAFGVSFAVLSVYACLANRSRRFFVNARARKRLNRTAGCVLAATGIALAVE